MELEQIKEIYAEYINDPRYVYKASGPSNIIILMKDSNTITNEKRKNVSKPLFASHRANKLFVVKIFDKMNPTLTKDKAKGTFYMSNRITYRVGEYVEADSFDNDLEKISTNGIHYYLTIDIPYYKNINLIENYNGKKMGWYANGNPSFEDTYLNGKCSHTKEFYNSKSNSIKEEFFLQDDELANGSFISYFRNGKVESTGQYKSGDKVGKWEFFLED